MFSKAHLKIKLKTKKHSKKSTSFDFIEFRILNFISREWVGGGREVLIAAGGRGGRIFFKKQISGGGGGGGERLFGTLEQMKLKVE